MKTKDEIKLLEKAICGYLPYKVKAVKNNVIHTITAVNTRYDFCELDEEINEQVEDIKLFLRPMSSMTEEEDKEWQYYKNAIAESCDELLEKRISELHDWFCKKHFDYCGLLDRGLALEAPEGMYDAFTDTSTQSSNNCNKIIMDL